MGTLKDSYHFIPNTDLLRIDGETSFQEVYNQLHLAGQGGFLLVEEGEVQTYVRAYDLADAVVHRTVKEVTRMFPDNSEVISESLGERMGEISRTPIRQIIRDVRSWIFVPVDQTPVDVSAAEIHLQDQDQRVFKVYENGESIGWYLNHESVRDTTTEKPVFVCKNGHKNPDTDHGTCYYCSNPISDADKQ